MYSYHLPDFKYPVYSVNFDPISETLYNQYNNKINLTEIENLLQSHQQIILDFNRDHANFLFGEISILKVYSYFSSLGFDNIFYLTSEYLPDHPAIRFFPAWLYHKSKSYQNVQIQTKEYRQYTISCLNRFPSPHRVYLFYHLLQKPYFEQCLTSFIGIRNPYNKFTDVGEYNEIYKDIPENVKKFFESTKYNKTTESNIQDWNELHDPNYVAFTDAYLNIITESTYFHSFFTEKTAKPLVSEQLFVMAGGADSIRNLNKLGFECFEPLIDSGYDSTETWIDRINYVLKVIDSIYFDIEDIYFHYQKERKYNKEYFLSDTFRNKCLDPVRDLLK